MTTSVFVSGFRITVWWVDTGPTAPDPTRTYSHTHSSDLMSAFKPLFAVSPCDLGYLKHNIHPNFCLDFKAPDSIETLSNRRTPSMVGKISSPKQCA